MYWVEFLYKVRGNIFVPYLVVFSSNAHCTVPLKELNGIQCRYDGQWQQVLCRKKES